MSTEEPNLLPNGSAMNCVQSSCKRSFIVSVDSHGNIEVSPTSKSVKMCITDTEKKSRNDSHVGKQRIRIALIDGGTDEEHDRSNVIDIDPQSFKPMHDQYVEVYNKNLCGKPSFVVLEDIQLRKRVEQTLNSHCNAQQQTCPFDVSAHTGCQTDEFLLRSQGHSRGCQATDINVDLPVCNCCHKISSKSLHHVPTLCQVRALQLANKTNQHRCTYAAVAEAAATAAIDNVPHVTISITPQDIRAKAPFMNPHQPNQQQQHVQAASVSSNNVQLSGSCTCSNCNHCCLRAQATSNTKCCPYAAAHNYSCFLKPLIQQQQQQQQAQEYPVHLPMPQQQQYSSQLPILQQQQQGSAMGTSNNCCSSCCFLRPRVTPTAIGFGHSVITPSHANQQVLLPSEMASPQQQQQHRVQSQEYPVTGCPQACVYYPVSTQNPPIGFGMPFYANSHLQPHQQMQQYVCSADCVNVEEVNRKESVLPESQSLSDNQMRHERSIKRTASKEIPTNPEPYPLLNLYSSASQVTVRRMRGSSANKEGMAKTELELNTRNRMATAGPSQASKFYMARFGRTCLILKPTRKSSRLLTKRINSHKTSKKST